MYIKYKGVFEVSTHSRPKAAATSPHPSAAIPTFQHTAARRRLEREKSMIAELEKVSTHSRPKAAEHHHITDVDLCRVSTHSRPKAAVVGSQKD